MNPWPFVIAAYGLTFAVSAGVAFASWRVMRRAEAAADALRK